MADGKGELGSRAGPLEKVGVATIFCNYLGGEFGKFAREEARVVADADRGLSAASLLGKILLCIGNQPLGSAADVVVVHRICADARKLRPPKSLRSAFLCFRHDSADGLATETAGPKRERAEKPVIQLLPIAGLDELGNGSLADRR